MFGADRCQLFLDDLHLIGDMGTAQVVEHVGDLGQQQAALSQGCHRVLEGGLLGIVHNGFDLLNVLSHGLCKGRTKVLVSDRLEGWYPEGCIELGEQRIVHSSLLFFTGPGA